MSKKRSQDVRIRGIGIAARFSLVMGIALAVVTAGGSFIQFKSARRVSSQAVEKALIDAAKAAAEVAQAERAGRGPTFKRSDTFQRLEGGTLQLFDVEFTSGSFKGKKGQLYHYDEGGDVIVPLGAQERSEKTLVAIFWGLTGLVILVGLGVAMTVATQVTRPLNDLVDDVRMISRGNLNHRTRVTGGGEVAQLARAIDRMAVSLAEAREAEIELSVREREVAVAQEVREALLPEDTPALPGFEFADRHIGCPEPGGDFHDYIFSNGKVTLIVCEVSGRGIPGALVGATARAYLRSELEREDDLAQALRKVNRDLARDMRRGMYVTAMCVRFDPKEGVATVACAGHRQPLVRYDARAGSVREIQPEGIALGFDKGPIFDRSLEVVHVPIEAGDRLVLANTGPVSVVNQRGEELGSTEFYREIKRGAKARPDTLLEHLEGVFEDFAGGEAFPADISLLILARNGEQNA